MRWVVDKGGLGFGIGIGIWGGVEWVGWGVGFGRGGMGL